MSEQTEQSESKQWDKWNAPALSHPAFPYNVTCETLID